MLSSSFAYTTTHTNTRRCWHTYSYGSLQAESLQHSCLAGETLTKQGIEADPAIQETSPRRAPLCICSKSKSATEPNFHLATEGDYSSPLLRVRSTFNSRDELLPIYSYFTQVNRVCPLSRCANSPHPLNRVRSPLRGATGAASPTAITQKPSEFLRRSHCSFVERLCRGRGGF